jgi:hypothetical protein
VSKRNNDRLSRETNNKKKESKESNKELFLKKEMTEKKEYGYSR